MLSKDDILWKSVIILFHEVMASDVKLLLFSLTIYDKYMINNITIIEMEMEQSIIHLTKDPFLKKSGDSNAF